MDSTTHIYDQLICDQHVAHNYIDIVCQTLANTVAPVHKLYSAQTP